MKTVNRKQLPPTLSRLSRKQRAFVSALGEGEGVSTSGSWWDEGSRSTFCFVHIASGQTRAAPDSTAPPAYGGVIRQLVPERGWVVVQGGTFRGKAATLHVHVREDDVAQFCSTEYPLGLPPGIGGDWLEERGEVEAARRVRQMFA